MLFLLELMTVEAGHLFEGRFVIKCS